MLPSWGAFLLATCVCGGVAFAEAWGCGRTAMHEADWSHGL